MEDCRKFDEKHPTLDKILKSFWIIPELTVYQLSDIFTIPARNWIIPKALKKEFPSLSCRGRIYYNDRPACKPSEKYEHKSLFLFRYFCKNYEDGKCTKYKK